MSYNFADLKITEPLLTNLKTLGYSEPTPFQKEAIPHIFDGRDILGCSPTRSGKTAAFSLPVLQMLTLSKEHAPVHSIHALIVVPASVNARHSHERIRTYARKLNIRHTDICAGTLPSKPASEIKKGARILITTPCRLLEMTSSGLSSLGHIRFLVLDEADQLEKTGLLKEVTELMSTIPKTRQTMIFSRTLSRDVLNIAESVLNNPVVINQGARNTKFDEARTMHQVREL